MTENESKYGKIMMVGGGRNAGKTFKAQMDMLKELEEYRAIGNIEEFKVLKEKNEDCIVKHLAKECSYNETGCSDCKGKEKIRIALEKQVPKKPIRKPNADMTHEEVTCPTCGSYCSAFKNKYCDCGQKLDWEGGE